MGWWIGLFPNVSALIETVAYLFDIKSRRNAQHESVRRKGFAAAAPLHESINKLPPEFILLRWMFKPCANCSVP